MSTSYLTLTNNAINESGADLATFATSGADWSTTTDSLRLKFKTWVARAWKEIQQDSFDLSFMEEQAVVNIDPGVMFYTDGTPVVTFSEAFTDTSTDIYDQDGSVAISAVPMGTFYDLTGTSTNTLPFGYFNVVTTASTPISWALKPGAEYLYTTKSTTFASGYDFFANSPNVTAYTNNLSGITLPILATLTVNGLYTYNVALASFGSSTPSPGVFLYSFEIGCSSSDGTSIASHLGSGGTMSFADPNNSSRIFLSITSSSFAPDFNGASHVVTTTEKAFIHSWKSFDFSEETGKDDFQENIKEINQKSFRIINYFQAPPQSEVPVNYVPWESFQPLYDLSGSAPGIPRIITRDNQNRFRLYPHPYQKMTLKFDYIRTPQILSAYTDIPKGIDDDIVDMIMWKALVMYGEYDEQPSVIARANKNFKNYQMRFDQKYRQKFHFQPKRLW